jgi:hypothetical protein
MHAAKHSGYAVGGRCRSGSFTCFTFDSFFSGLRVHQVLVLLYVCPHTTIYLSSYYCMCPHTIILLCVSGPTDMCPHTTISVSSYYYICVLILLYLCPQLHLRRRLRILLYVRPHTTICVPILLYVCPHTSISVSSVAAQASRTWATMPLPPYLKTRTEV